MGKDNVVASGVEPTEPVDDAPVEEVAENISAPREVRIVNLSEQYAALGNKGKTKFVMEGTTVTVDTPGNLIRRGRAPYVKDTRFVSPVGPPRSALLMGYGKVGARQPGGDGGLRNYDQLTPSERAVLVRLISEAKSGMTREGKMPKPKAATALP